jgi:glycerophosphoryl diester phosphodiesterase
MTLWSKIKLLILLSFLTLLLNKCDYNYELPEQGICAHRGANVTHPENTLSAFKEAIRLGAHMIEFDVRMSKDGELIIIHDATVDRTTNGKGAVAELNFSDLRKLDAGSWKDLKYKGEKIPTFSEVIDIMPKNIWLNIHIKGGVEAAKKVAKIIISENRKHQAVIACKTEAAHAVREIDNSILICNMERLNNSEEYVNGTIAMKANFIQLKVRSDDSLPELISRLKANGIKINYYGTNSPEKLKRLFKYGVNFPLVDNLKEMMDVAKEFGINPVEPLYE